MVETVDAQCELPQAAFGSCQFAANRPDKEISKRHEL
jgi:hypothetical protein